MDSTTKNSFSECPYCRSGDIEEIEDSLWHCNYCSTKWDDEGLVEE